MGPPLGNRTSAPQSDLRPATGSPSPHRGFTRESDRAPRPLQGTHPVLIPVNHGHLEAHLRPAEGALRGAAVLCHPHPLHGGTMHTKAVFRAAQALNAAGFHALRFNFRSVGTSTGSHDDGIGEQDDARAALDWLATEYPELPLLLGGFSFGSRVGLTVGVEDDRVRGMLGMGLAVGLYDYGFLGRDTKPVLVVQGEEDEFGAGPDVAAALAPLGSHIKLCRIPGADHYFHNRFDELKQAIEEYFDTGAGADIFPRV